MNEPLFLALALAALAGVTIPLGAALAGVERFLPGWSRDEFRHTVIAFGGGALLAAIALVLVPQGSDLLQPLPALAWFAAGGIVFMQLDRLLARRGGHGAQFMAMMLDYVPEAMALGALLADNLQLAILLAGLIALQNLPEGFNAFRELSANPAQSPRRLMLLFVCMVPLGPLSAYLGMAVLGGYPQVLGATMMFSAGGILYLLFEDVAPQVPLDQKWNPPLGAVAGFMLGLAGHLFIG